MILLNRTPKILSLGDINRALGFQVMYEPVSPDLVRCLSGEFKIEDIYEKQLVRVLDCQIPLLVRKIIDWNEQLPKKHVKIKHAVDSSAILSGFIRTAHGCDFQFLPAPTDKFVRVTELKNYINCLTELYCISYRFDGCYSDLVVIVQLKQGGKEYFVKYEEKGGERSTLPQKQEIVRKLGGSEAELFYEKDYKETVCSGLVYPSLDALINAQKNEDPELFALLTNIE